MFIIFLNNSMIDVSLYYCVYSRDCEPIIATLATTFLVRSTSKAPNFTIRMCVLSIVLILYIYTRVSKDRESGGRRYRIRQRQGLDFEKGVDPPLSFYSRSMVSFGPRFTWDEEYTEGRNSPLNESKSIGRAPSSYFFAFHDVLRGFV